MSPLRLKYLCISALTWIALFIGVTLARMEFLKTFMLLLTIVVACCAIAFCIADIKYRLLPQIKGRTPRTGSR